MDNIEGQNGPEKVTDEVGTKCQRLFQEFLDEYVPDTFLFRCDGLAIPFLCYATKVA